MNYYVYILCDPRRDNEPLYVGKGMGRRANTHLRKGKSDNQRKSAKINKIRAAGLEPTSQFCATGLSEAAAYDLEAELIRRYGRAKIDEGGILTNICIDARPPIRSGPMSQAHRAAIAASNTGKKRTLEQSLYLSQIRQGKKRKPHSVNARTHIRHSLARTIAPDDLTGVEFGHWKVVSRGVDRIDNQRRGANAEYWLCQCSCGTEREVCRRNLLRGTTRSCGCRGNRSFIKGCYSMSEISKAKLAHRFRVHFDKFGTGLNLSNQVHRITRPHVVTFDPSYGVIGTEPIEIDLRDDAQDVTRTEVFTQLAEQISSNVSFDMIIETLDEEARVLERWYLMQCQISDCQLTELNAYNAAQLVIRLKITAKHVKASAGENLVTLH